jgi:hypothetical protein
MHHPPTEEIITIVITCIIQRIAGFAITLNYHLAGRMLAISS